MKIGLLINTKANLAMNDLIAKSSVAEAYRLLKINKMLLEIQDDFQKLRMVLLNRFCKRDEKGNLEISEDKTNYILSDIVAFNTEYEDLLNLEVDLVLPKSVFELIEVKPTPVKKKTRSKKAK